MIGADVAIILMYVIAMIYTRYAAFLILTLAMSASFFAFWPVEKIYKIEYLYFLTQSVIWLFTAIALKKSKKIAISALVMSVYEWIVAVESFVWQFITPVETPLHSQYAIIIIAIHLYIISTTAKRGGEIGYFHWPAGDRLFARSDL